jgi:hypothetical protein
VSSDGKLMAAPVEASATSFRASPPAALFQTQGNNGFAPDRLGRRFLILQQENNVPITVVVSWESLLRRPS